MAVTAGKSPILFTAANDVFVGQIKIATIRVITAAAAGTVIIKDSTAKVIWERIAMAANDSDETTLPDTTNWYDGITIDTLPTGAKVYIYFQ